MQREIIMQANCWKWHWNTYPAERGWLRRVKNELDTHPYKKQLDIRKQLSENKSTGVVAGTWDMFYMIKPFIWIEFKVGDNDLSEAQLKFQIRGEEIGHVFFVFYSEVAFQNFMTEFHK